MNKVCYEISVCKRDRNSGCIPSPGRKSGGVFALRKQGRPLAWAGRGGCVRTPENAPLPVNGYEIDYHDPYSEPMVGPTYLFPKNHERLRLFKARHLDRTNTSLCLFGRVGCYCWLVQQCVGCLRVANRLLGSPGRISPNCERLRRFFTKGPPNTCGVPPAGFPQTVNAYGDFLQRGCQTPGTSISWPLSHSPKEGACIANPFGFANVFPKKRRSCITSAKGRTPLVFS